MTGVGALMLTGQVRIGSPVTGIDFTLMRMTAVVLSGASIAGGRGSFLGTLVGCVLLQLMLSAATFLQAGAAWQYALISGTTLAVAALFCVVPYARPGEGGGAPGVPSSGGFHICRRAPLIAGEQRAMTTGAEFNLESA